MSKCPICQVLLRELCINERDPSLCSIYKNYELEKIKGEKALNIALEKAGYKAYKRAKNSIKEKEILPKELF